MDVLTGTFGCPFLLGLLLFYIVVIVGYKCEYKVRFKYDYCFIKTA